MVDFLSLEIFAGNFQTRGFIKRAKKSSKIENFKLVENLTEFPTKRL